MGLCTRVNFDSHTFGVVCMVYYLVVVISGSTIVIMGSNVEARRMYVKAWFCWSLKWGYWFIFSLHCSYSVPTASFNRFHCQLYVSTDLTYLPLLMQIGFHCCVDYSHCLCITLPMLSLLIVLLGRCWSLLLIVMTWCYHVWSTGGRLQEG